MDYTQMEALILTKSFEDLTSDELLALSDWCSDETSFNALKKAFEPTDVNSSLLESKKKELDNLFLETYGGAQIRTINSFQKWKSLSIAATVVGGLGIALVVYFSSNKEQVLVAKNSTKKTQPDTELRDSVRSELKEASKEKSETRTTDSIKLAWVDDREVNVGRDFDTTVAQSASMEQEELTTIGDAKNSEHVVIAEAKISLPTEKSKKGFNADLYPNGQPVTSEFTVKSSSRLTQNSVTYLVPMY